jgi:predicted DsbA family dithiol-disulfide isomerase
MCPYCYIGKEELKALAPHAANVEIECFQLDASLHLMMIIWSST